MEIQNELIMKVCSIKPSGQKIVTIPKRIENIQDGDFVRIEKVKISVEGVID